MDNPQISRIDKFQSGSPDAVFCLEDSSHGKLIMSGTTNSLVCGPCGRQYLCTPEFLKAVAAFSTK